MQVKVPVHDDQHLREVKHPSHITPPQPITKRIHVISHYNPNTVKLPSPSRTDRKNSSAQNQNQNLVHGPQSQTQNQNVRPDTISGGLDKNKHSIFNLLPDQPPKPQPIGQYEPRCKRKNDIVYVKTHKTASSTIANVIHR